MPAVNSRWQIRPLTAEHVRGLAACHIDCWREAYRGLVPDHVLDAFDLDRRADSVERIRQANPNHFTIAVADGTVIGFAGAGPPLDDPAPAETQLYALYVRAAWYGTGVAGELILAALDPHASCALWVFEENPRAQSFYRKHGFTLDGARRVEAFTPAVELRMVRGLDS